MCINVPTSNHNSAKVITLNFSVVYYHVPTSNHNPLPIPPYRSKVVYYHVPTSNHNYLSCIAKIALLYIIMFLHQTTTCSGSWRSGTGCILSCSYIKPQRRNVVICHNQCCILSCSYIKPQQQELIPEARIVVYYHVPTSNHNRIAPPAVYKSLYIIMFLHQTTTVGGLLNIYN